MLGLVLNDNGLSGSLPQTLARLRRLRHLDVRHNALTTLPAGLGDASEALQLLAAPQSPPGLSLALVTAGQADQ